MLIVGASVLTPSPEFCSATLEYANALAIETDGAARGGPRLRDSLLQRLRPLRLFRQRACATAGGCRPRRASHPRAEVPDDHGRELSPGARRAHRARRPEARGRPLRRAGLR